LAPDDCVFSEECHPGQHDPPDELCMNTKAKVLLLIPAAFAGAFTVLALDIPVRTRDDVLIPIAVLSPIYLALIAVLGLMWRQHENRRYLGHTRRVWAFMLAAAYLIGAVSAALL
jgi:ABC-type Na+ efflux pump permease subunit